MALWISRYNGSMSDNRQPLAEQLRPQTLDEVIGQSHLLGEGELLRRIVKNGEPVSLILWGPPGTGKTTLARIIAHEVKAEFIELSAVTSGKKDVEQVIEHARQNWNLGLRTILFVDEIHRFNKAQQDAFLPHVESGLITLIGATTENPSFEVINATTVAFTSSGSPAIDKRRNHIRIKKSAESSEKVQASFAQSSGLFGGIIRWRCKGGAGQFGIGAEL